MASETVDPIDWSHPQPSWAIPPELHVLHGVNAAYKSQGLLHRDSNTRPRECQTSALPVRPLRVSYIMTPHDNVCCLILEWGGTVKGDPVTMLLPACSATVVCRVRIVEPTYSDAQRAQLNLYTREDRIANRSLSLKVKKGTNLEVVNYNNVIIRKNLMQENIKFRLHFLRLCPKVRQREVKFIDRRENFELRSKNFTQELFYSRIDRAQKKTVICEKRK